MERRRFLSVAGALAAGCRGVKPRNGEEDAALCLPPETLAIAGVHLDQVRASEAWRALPQGWLAVLEPLREAGFALVAYSEKGLLVIAHGHFAAAPAGAALLSPQLALAGSSELVQAASRQHAAGKTGAPMLWREAQPVASKPIWLVVPGRASLPLTGNLANLNRLLRYTTYTTVSAEVNSGVALELAGWCPAAESADQLEETLRGMATFAAGTTHDRDLKSLLDSVRIRRQNSTVYINLSASPAVIAKLLHS